MSSSRFFVRYIQIMLRLLDAGVPEHELNDADLDAVRQQPTRALMPQVVPSEIDPLELFPDSIPRRSRPGFA
jgi:hypothetical protein